MTPLIATPQDHLPTSSTSVPHLHLRSTLSCSTAPPWSVLAYVVTGSLILDSSSPAGQQEGSALYNTGQPLSHNMSVQQPMAAMSSMMAQQQTSSIAAHPPSGGGLNMNIQQQQQRQHTFDWVRQQQVHHYTPRGPYPDHTPLKPLHLFGMYGGGETHSMMSPHTQQYHHPQPMHWGMEYAYNQNAQMGTAPGVLMYREPPHYGQLIQPSQYQQASPPQLTQQQMMSASSQKPVPHRPQQHHLTSQQEIEKRVPHCRPPPPAYPHQMEGLHQYQPQQFDTQYDTQPPTTEDSDRAQKRMWQQDSSSSIFSNPTVPPSVNPVAGYQDMMNQTQIVEVSRDKTGSLGINVCSDEGSIGVYIMSLSRTCQAMTKGRLNPGDRIIEVRSVIV